MIAKILRFELWARFKQPLTLLFFLMLVFQGIWYTQGNYEYYVNDATLMNGAALFYKNFAGGGILLIIILAIITGTVLHKDIQYQMAGIMYTTPINQKKFFLGRFLSAYVINLIIAFGMLIGMALTPYSGIGTPDKFGPMPWAQMFHGFFVLTAVNLLMLTMVCFSVIVFFKKMTAGYLSVFLLVMLFLVAESTSDHAGDMTFYELLDPFTFVYTSSMMDALPADQKNTGFLTFNSIFFLNRFIWIGGTSVFFLLAYRRFTFKQFIATGDRQKKSITESLKQRVFGRLSLPSVHLNFSTMEMVRKFWRLARLEFLNVVRPVNFKIILSILALMFFLQNIMWNATYYLGPQQPLTSSMTFVRLPMGFFIMMILMIWAGELFFKDRISNIWQITDALPVPVWVTTLSKFLAVSGVALITALVIIGCGILAQLLMGGWQEIDLMRYADDVLGYKWGWLTYLQNIALVFFLAGLTGNRFLTHILGVGYYLFNIISFDMGIMEELRFGYALTPGVEDFSDVNGYGIWTISSWWYFLLWTSLAIVFVLLGIHFWQRGSALNFSRKLMFQTNQLNWSGKGLVVLCLASFFLLQSFIVREVNEKGNFETETAEAIDNAAYEKKYKWIESKSHPRLTQLDLSLDLFPAERKAVYQARMELSNLTNAAIDTVYLYHEDFVRFQEWHWNDQLVEAAWKDDDFHQLAIPVQLDSGATGILRLSAFKAYDGFTQSDAQPDLTFNGLFLSATDIIPSIGYNDGRELDRNRDRVTHGLTRIGSRMAPVSDPVASQQDYVSPQSEWFKGSVIISTSGNQKAVGPGKAVKEWQADGRNYKELMMEKSAPYNWYFASAEYEVREFRVGELTGKMWYKPAHPYNLNLFQGITGQSLAFINEYLGEYPYTALNLVEIPFYQEARYGYPNVIAISEKEGWYADTTGIAERAYLTYSIAGEMIGQWLKQEVKIANVQGADMLKIALPEALALNVVKTTYGQEAVEDILEKKLNFYNKERGNETNVEPALIYADGAEYLEPNLGVIALYALSEKVGIGQFTTILKQWKEDGRGQPLVFESLYKELLQVVAAEDRKAVQIEFEQVLN